jgi:hypothetical protein
MSNRFLAFFCHQAKLYESPHELFAHEQEQLLYVDESWMQLQDSHHEGSAQLPYEVRLLFFYIVHQAKLHDSSHELFAHEQQRVLFVDEG